MPVASNGDPLFQVSDYRFHFFRFEPWHRSTRRKITTFSISHSSTSLFNLNFVLTKRGKNPSLGRNSHLSQTRKVIRCFLFTASRLCNKHGSANSLNVITFSRLPFFFENEFFDLVCRSLIIFFVDINSFFRSWRTPPFQIFAVGKWASNYTKLVDLLNFYLKSKNLVGASFWLPKLLIFIFSKKNTLIVIQRTIFWNT